MLAACARRIQSSSASAVASRGVGEQGGLKQGLVASYASKTGSQVSKASLATVATRKYSTAQSALGTDTKKWNIELNRLFKLRFYDDVTSAYAKMKQGGAAPDATTFMIVFDSHIANCDNNSVVELVKEAKAGGVKTSFLDKDEQMHQLLASGDDSPDLELKSIHLQQYLRKFRQAGLNPFDPSH